MRPALLPAFLLAAGSSLLGAPVSAASGTTPLEELMGSAAFERTGMDKLDADEREALQRWLEGYVAGSRAAANPVAGASPEPPAPSPDSGAPSEPAMASSPAPGAAPAPAEPALDETTAGREGPSWLPWVGADDEEAQDAPGVQEETAGRDGGLFAFLGRDAQDEGGNAFRSRIDGAFEGWRGDTRFLLENGQVWEQRRADIFLTDLDSPEVVLRRNRLGFYSMEVPAAGESVLVKRIR